MNKPLKLNYVFSFLLILTTILYGCGAPLKYAYQPLQGEKNQVRATKGISIYIAPVQDLRKGLQSGKKIGNIHTTVLDIYGNELFLSRRPALVIRDALIKEFKSAGFTVLSETQKDAQYLLETKLKEFEFEIGAKDSMKIALYMEVLKTESKKNLGGDIIKTSDSRFAGVSGTSRKSISRAISISISKVMKQVIEKTENDIKKDHPAKNSTKEQNNKETIIGRKERAGKGLLRVTTEPMRAKIFLNKIFYGLSPQTLRVKAGIYNLLIRKDGYVDFSEKVAIDKERETEVEERLRKQPAK